MNLTIIGSRSAIINQVRVAIKATGFNGTINLIESLSGVGRNDSATSTSPDLVFVVMPDDIAVGVEFLHRLRSQTSARVAIVGPASEPHVILSCLHAGADAYLDQCGDLFAQVAAECQRVERSASVVNQSGNLVAVIAACGGIGATVTAANLSVLIAAKLETCGLIDLTTTPGDLAQLFNLSPRYTLNELCVNRDSLDRAMLTSSFTEHDSGVRLIASAANDTETTMENDRHVARVVHIARSCLPTVVMDLDRRAPYAQELIEASDVVLLLSALNFNSACAARRQLAGWQKRGIPSDRILLVACRAGQPGEIPVDKVGQILGRNVDTVLSEDAMTVNLSINCGQPLVTEWPNASLSAEYRHLTGCLLSRLKLAQPSQDSPTNAVGGLRGPFRRGTNVLQRVAGMFA